jgi:lysophospholipase L1-like esterase
MKAQFIAGLQRLEDGAVGLLALDDRGSLRTASEPWTGLEALALVSSRPLGTLYAQTSATTAAAYAAGSALVVSAPGDADWISGATLPGGAFGGPGWTNDFPSPFSVNAWSVYNATQGLPVDRTAPDGTLTAIKIIDASSLGTAYYISASGFRSSAVWYRYESTPTVLGSFLGAGSSVPLSAAAPVTKWGMFWAPALNASTGGVAGLSATPWNTVPAAAGALVVWGAQTALGATILYARLPIAVGTVAATVLSVSAADAAKVVRNGRLGVAVRFLSLYRLRSGWNNLSGSVSFFSGASANGTFEVRRTASSTIELVVRGAVALTVAGAYVQTSDGAGDGGQWHEIECWYDTAANQCGIRQTVNGCVTQTTGPTTGGPLAPLSAFWIGSHLGTSDFFIGLYQSAQTRSAAPSSAFEIAIVGDSEPGGSVSPALGASLYSLAQSKTRPGIFSIARGGARISDAMTFWLAADNLARGNPAVRVIIVECGTNNILQGADAATTATAMAKLTARIHADNPGAKIVLMGIVPIYSFPAVRTAYNAILMNPSGGIYADVRIPCPAALDDGAGGLAIAYAIDNLHPNTAGKRLQAAPLIAALQAQGVLP